MEEKKDTRKAYYICQSCQNKFPNRKQLERHLTKILGCVYLKDTSTELKKIFEKKFMSLELGIESLKLDFEHIDPINRSRRIKYIKGIYIVIERLYKNHGHLYKEEESELLGEFIEDYKNEIEILIKNHYTILSKLTINDI